MCVWIIWSFFGPYQKCSFGHHTEEIRNDYCVFVVHQIREQKPTQKTLDNYYPGIKRRSKRSECSFCKRLCYLAKMYAVC